MLRQHRPRGLAVGTRRKASRQPLPTPAQASAESGIHGRLALWPHPERYTARRSGQSHIGKHLPGPVGPVCREIPHPSQHLWHSPKNQPSVERVEGPHGNPRKKGKYLMAAQLRKQMQQLPSYDPQDPGYRRLRYVRYADDFALGFIGPKAEAEQIKESLETFLRDTLKLELSRKRP